MVQPCQVAGTTTTKGSCTLMEITQVQDSALKLQHNPGSSGPTWNPKIPYQNANNWPAFKASDSCKAYGICIPKPDPAMSQRFSITSNDLTVNSLVVAPGIVDMQAEYGINNAAAGATTTITWQPPTGAWDGNTSALTQAQIKQIKAVRLAMVARSGEYEKPTNTAGTCQTTTTAPKFSWGTFDTSKWPADWQCYRYKVFETEVPLINILWMNVTTTP